MAQNQGIQCTQYEDILNRLEDDNKQVLALSSKDALRYNYCKNCEIPMELIAEGYQCEVCGVILNLTMQTSDHTETSNGILKITSGSSRGSFYHYNVDSVKLRKKVILQQLKAKKNEYAGPAISEDILEKTADAYVDIQVKCKESRESKEQVTPAPQEKNFVHRSGIKDEIIAAILYFECVKAGMMRKRKDIVAFMRLSTSGFSRGESILRGLHSRGIYMIPTAREALAEDFVGRYLEALKIDNARYCCFVTEIVEMSERLNIGILSHVSSKVVGTIWLLIVNEGLNISISTLESLADKTKKNTFARFTDEVIKYMGAFKDIFIKYNISMVPSRTRT